MHIDILPVGPLQTNCYLATCEDTGEALLIDPGWNDDRIQDAILARRADVKLVVNTHAHWDHIGGNAAYLRTTGAQFAIHPVELPLLEARGGAKLLNIAIPPSPVPDLLLEPGQSLEVGALRFEVLFTPGHTPGHVSLYEADQGVLFDGDVLFRRGIGRADLPGGDPRVLLHSIRDVLLSLPDEVTVYPGHGPQTTIGEERRLNPWLGDLDALD